MLNLYYLSMFTLIFMRYIINSLVKDTRIDGSKLLNIKLTTPPEFFAHSNFKKSVSSGLKFARFRRLAGVVKNTSTNMMNILSKTLVQKDETPFLPTLVQSMSVG